MKLKIKCEESRYAEDKKAFIITGWDINEPRSRFYIYSNEFDRGFALDGRNEVFDYNKQIMFRSHSRFGMRKTVVTDIGLGPEKQYYDGHYTENLFNITWKDLVAACKKIKPGDTTEISSWDEGEDKITHNLMEVRKHLNDLIAKRTAYGVRKEIAPRKGYQLVWSNQQERWLRGGIVTFKGEEMKLDANYFFAPYTAAEIDAVIDNLGSLPIFAYSLEAKKGFLGRPKEELEKHLEKLKTEMDIAEMEGDKIRMGTIAATIIYVQNLLNQVGQEHLK